ncbi:MAG: outer membrane beta-barrel protein [Gemmatimonadetes bacterium]|nr:outer membrane beta-barrel protein [Gemmatimonadota bacterium]
MKLLQEVQIVRGLGRWLAVLWVAMSGVALGPGSAVAQEEDIDTPYRWVEGGTRLGLVGGYIFTNRGDPPFGPGSSPFIGTRFRARLSSPLSLELGLGYGSSNEYVIDPRLEGGPAIVDTVNADWLIIQASLQFAFTGARSYHRLQPYVVLGGGVLQGLSTETSDVLASPQQPFVYEIGTSMMVHLGVGAEYHLSRRWGLAFEVRDNLWKIRTPDGWFRIDVLENILDSGSQAADESQWTHNFELTASLYYYF